jgi:hypothetical protein
VLKSFKVISRLSVILLIFFSLQGEAIARLAEAFGHKIDHTTAFVKRNDTRQRLVRLQCFTQKLDVTALSVNFNANSTSLFRPVTFVARTCQYYSNYESPDHHTLTLRGPPLFA